jgi:ABC-2 type transport system permease protein
MFQVIYFNTPLLAGWRYEDIFLLIVTFLTVESLIIVTFHRNLSYYLPDLLKKGNFDFLLTKPLNPLFYSSFRIIDLMDLTSSILVVYLWYYYFVHYAASFSFFQVVLYLILIICSLVFIFSLLVIIASTAFWTINATGLGRFFENLVRVGRFPTDIFRGVFSFLFLYVFPIGIIATVPSKALLGLSNWHYHIYVILFTGILFWISKKVWNYALKNYSSASS